MAVVNPRYGPNPINQLGGDGQARPMSRFELHHLFREMVRFELHNGELSTWRRRRLVRYAAALEISAVDAGELIQEAVRAHESVQGLEPRSLADLHLLDEQDSEPSQGWRWYVPVAVMLAGAMLIAAGLIR